MDPFVSTIVLISALGLLGAIILVVASKVFAVEVDERVGDVLSMLPGANCGSCGYPGCEAYARAVLDGALCNSCGPGGHDVAEHLAAYLGVDAGGEVAVKRAIVACRGTADRMVLKEREAYTGAPSCRVFSTLGYTSDACTDGCIGFGDCVASCPYGALTLNKNNVAVVDPAVCIGCGLCTTICPRHLISLQEKDHISEVSFVLCHNTLMGKRAKEACANTCLGCHRCERACPNQCIRVENNVARIDVSKCVDCKVCVEICPVGAINPLAWVPRR